MNPSDRVTVLSFIMICGVAVFSCGPSINYDYDFAPNIDFSEYKTYTWAQPADNAAQATRGVDQITERRIIAAVDEQLESKGYSKVTSGKPDFVVNFVGMAQDKVDVTTWHTGWGYYGWYGGTTVDVRNWTEGTLIIDIIDAESTDLSWRGLAQAAIGQSRSPEERNSLINQAVAGILSNFPPRS